MALTAAQRMRRWREKNPEKYLRLARESQARAKAKDPVAYAEKKAIWALSQHGLTVEQYDALLEEQGGRCAICGSPDPGSGPRSKRFVVDHDHDHCPGKFSCGECVRGLLCNACNVGIAMLQDDPTIAESAARYLKGGN